jgi:hypothetical protein
VLREHQIGWRAVRVLEGDRRLERRLKGRGLAHLCPVCTARPTVPRGPHKKLGAD